MIYREALVSDIKNIQLVRNAVKENALSDPHLVTDEDCKEYLTVRGKGWVCELNNKIAGFAIVDLRERNVWALFIRPEHEGKGIGKYLHDLMIDWYFEQTHEKIWLGTAFYTRAVGFYHNLGWIEVGKNGSKEVKFEMTFNDWRLKNSSNKDNSTSDFIAMLTYKTTEQGGRQTAAKSGYRPQVKFEFEAMQTSGRQIFIDRELALPGDTLLAEIKITSLDYFANKLTEGMEFEFREGPRVIGTGEIKHIINDKLKKTGDNI